MCPLGDDCPKVKKIRWPNSNIKSVTNFGAQCQYAHHLSELEFPETLNTKINASKNQKKKVLGAVTSDKPAKPFMPASKTIDKLPPELDPKELAEKKRKLRAIMEKT